MLHISDAGVDIGIGNVGKNVAFGFFRIDTPGFLELFLSDIAQVLGFNEDVIHFIYCMECLHIVNAEFKVFEAVECLFIGDSQGMAA